MTRFEVTPPDVAVPPPGLGRVGAVLARIAGAQGHATGAAADLHHVALLAAAGVTPVDASPALDRVLSHSIECRAEVEAGHPPALAAEAGDESPTPLGAPSDTAAGVALVDRLVDGGTRLLVAEGADTAGAFVVLAALLDLEPVAAVGTSPSTGWSQQLVAVRDGLARSRAYVGDPERLLEVAGEPGLLAGALAQAAVRRTPVLLDGSAQVAAALLVADRIAPGVAAWCTATTAPATPGAVAALHDLGVEPLLDLGLTTRGAPLVLALLREAAAPEPARG